MSKDIQKKEAGTLHKRTAVLLVVAAVFAVGLLAALTEYTDIGVKWASVGTVLVYAVLCAAIFLLSERIHTKGEEMLRPVMGRIMFDTVVKMETPVFICDKSGRIMWFNSVTEELSENRKLYGESVDEVFGMSLESIRGASDSDGVEFTAGGRTFRTSYHHIKTDDEDFSLVVTKETTEVNRLNSVIDSSELAVGYIMIDNLAEMLQYDSEQYRPASSKIDEVIRDWAEDYGALIKEYERDKYFFITSADVLRKMIASKFDILDKVREVRAGETNLPLTLSLGVSAIDGSYEDKDKAARAALDMALQRGGDQAAVKSADSIDFFGGITKTVQKKTNVRARVVSNELMSEIKGAKNVIIMGHKRADFDAFGSCVGLARLAMYCGAEVNIVVDKSDRNIKAWREQLDSDDYNGVFLSGEEALDRLETGTLVVVADVNNLNITEEPELARRTEKLAVIDHHRKMSEFQREPDVEYIDPSASSACELVSEMLEQVLSNDELSPTEANAMLAGVTLDTKQFTKNTGTRTFSAAMYLRDLGADPVVIQSMSRESFEDYVREAQFRRNVEIYKNVYAIAVVDADDADRVIAAKAADNLLNVEGIKASFAIIKEGETVHISARSQGSINVQLIMEAMGGGGHFDGAAVQFTDKTVDEAVEALKAAIDNKE